MSSNQKCEIKIQKLPIRKIKSGSAIMPVKFTVTNFGLKDIKSGEFETDDCNKTRWYFFLFFNCFLIDYFLFFRCLKLHPILTKGILTVVIHLISSNYINLTDMKIRVVVTKKSHPYELYQENTDPDTEIHPGCRSWCFRAIFGKNHKKINGKDEELKMLVEVSSGLS